MRRVTVLAVDDDAPVLRTTAIRLRRAGYEVVEAPSGPAALSILESRSDITIIVSDCQMPQMSGADLARIALARWPQITFIAVSGTRARHWARAWVRATSAAVVSQQHQHSRPTAYLILRAPSFRTLAAGSLTSTTDWTWIAVQGRLHPARDLARAVPDLSSDRQRPLA